MTEQEVKALRGYMINAMLESGMTESQVAEVLDEPESLEALNKLAMNLVAMAKAVAA